MEVVVAVILLGGLLVIVHKSNRPSPGKGQVTPVVGVGDYLQSLGQLAASSQKVPIRTSQNATEHGAKRKSLCN